jgi:hypothetical protein
MKLHGGQGPEIDPNVAARALWLETHPLPSMSEETRVAAETTLILAYRTTSKT